MKVERTPKLGSMKDTLGFLKEVARESVTVEAGQTRVGKAGANAPRGEGCDSLAEVNQKR